MDNDYCGFGGWGPCGGVDLLAMTGGSDLTPYIVTAVLLAVGAGVLFLYNHLRKKKKW